MNHEKEPEQHAELPEDAVSEQPDTPSQETEHPVVSEDAVREQTALTQQVEQTDEAEQLEAAAEEVVPLEHVPWSKRTGQKKNIFDQIWDFFSSVQVGITIILLLAIGSALGSILPQENAIPSRNPDAYYVDTYGNFGDLYHRLGLSDTYNSWWYLMLVLMLAISLIIVSIDRGIPLYKSLKNQPVARKVMMLKLDRLYTNRESASEETIDELAVVLKKRRYKVRREEGALLAEKGRIPRFGAYIIHFGLIIIIIGCFTRLIPGWYYSDMLWLKEGERKAIPQVGFAVQNDGFQVEYYPGNDFRPKKYETDASVYVNDQQVAKGHIKVNEFMTYNHTKIFQNSFDPNPMFKTGTVQMIDKKTQKPLGTFTIDFNDPQMTYHVGAYTLTMVNYYPDIQIDPQTGVRTQSQDPYNPGMQFDITGPGVSKAVREWMLPRAPFIEQMLGKSYPFTLKFLEVNTFNMTGLKIERDLGIPIVYSGLSIVLLGLVLVFYFQHRRIWARLEDGVLHVSANTNKNWIGMTNDFNKAVTTSGFEPAKLKSRLNKQ